MLSWNALSKWRVWHPCGGIAAVYDKCHGRESRASGRFDDGDSLMANLSIGEKFERVVTFDEAGARAFATLVGDFNPAHHDEDFAAKSRFGGLIISGTQSVAILMAMTATILSAKGSALGLEYHFRFRKAVRMGETVTMAWVVTEITPKPGLGDIVTFEASLTVHSTGDVAVSGTGKCVLLKED
jgi:acyl dehydratase